MERKTEKVLGYNVDLLTFDDSVKFVLKKIENKEGLHVVTINPEIIELAEKDIVLSSIIKTAGLVVADGAGIEFALKYKGIKQERIAGIDLAHELVNSCQYFSYPIALIGAKEHVIETTVKRLKSEFEGIDICYYRNGYFTSNKEDEIIKALSETEPKLVLVALGAPKQEYFINKCKKIMPETTFIGIGGTFDVWAGEVERAPKIYRTLRCEWLYRTIKQPKRIKRIYKTLPMFLFKAIIDGAKSRFVCVKKGNK